MLPMWQSEAMWLQFSASHVPGHRHVWPFSVKVSTGKRSAITGKPWYKTLQEGDYLIIPEQKWLDGYVVEDGVIRQFVAAPLGMGSTVEEQITGKAEFGGLHIEVYPMSRAEYERRWPPVLERIFKRRSMLRSKEPDGFSEIVARPDMGLAPGGRMAQQVFSDTYGIDAWDKSQHDRCFVHLSNSIAWKAITGKNAPTIHCLPLTTAGTECCGMGTTKMPRRSKCPASCRI